MALNQFEKYILLNKKIPSEILLSLKKIKNAERLADSIAAHITLKLTDKQSLLEINNIQKTIRIFISNNKK
ncbi:hypothetical protein HIC20_00985 [Buchnera aphidicola (Hormaphis cornu)]|nr:hypothetical protein HIC20_00985 [Buchnera aphidicola (Hormaphis cornu)]